MRNSVLLFVLSLLLFSCSGNENKTPAKIDSVISSIVAKDTVDTDAVKKKSIQSDPAKMDSVSEKNSSTDRTTINPSPSFDIKGRVYYSLSYCGGARPTEEIIRELATPKLLPNSAFMLRNKDSKYRIQTNQDGEFTANLPAGHFDVYFTKGTNLKNISGTANNCDNCITQLIASVNIVAGKKAVINIAFHCKPEDANRP